MFEKVVKNIKPLTEVTGKLLQEKKKINSHYFYKKENTNPDKNIIDKDIISIKSIKKNSMIKTTLTKNKQLLRQKNKLIIIFSFINSGIDKNLSNTHNKHKDNGKHLSPLHNTTFGGHVPQKLILINKGFARRVILIFE